MQQRISKLRHLIVNNLPVILILILASFYRLYRIEDYMTFLGDEGRDVLVVYNILHGKLTLLGPTSSVGGFFLGPIYYYFMAPFLWLFNYNPVGPAIGVALIGIATVFLLYKIALTLFNKRIALIASFLYSISPLVVTYSRSSWNPNPMPFVSLLTLISVFYAIKKNSLKLFVMCGFLMGIAFQFHYLALFLGTIVLFYVLFTTVYKSNLKRSIEQFIKRVGAIFLGLIIGWSPFLAFEIRHDFIDFKNVFNFVVHSQDTGVSSGLFSIIYDLFFRLFARTIFGFPPIEHTGIYGNSILWAWSMLALAIGVLSVVILLSNFYKSLKVKNENFYKYALLTFWLIIGISLFGLYKKAIYDYYLAFLFPLPFILVAILFDYIYLNKKILMQKLLVLILIILIVFLNLRSIPFQYEPNRQLNQMKSIAKFVEDKTQGKPFNFALITGGNSDHAYRYFFTIWNHAPITIEDPVHDPQRKTITSQLFVVCESLPCEPLGHSLWEVAGFGRAEIVGKWNVSVVEIYKLVHYRE